MWHLQDLSGRAGTAHSWRRRLDRRLWRVGAVAQLTGIVVLLVHAGFASISLQRVPEFNILALLSMALLSGSQVCRALLRRRSSDTWSETGVALMVLPAAWILGLLALLVWTPAGPLKPLVLWTEVVMAATAILSVLRVCRQLAGRTHNSAVLLVGSFLVLVTAGTILLQLPACRAGTDAGAPWHVALFTATSASCVTGLIVEPTGSYWTPLGHTVILCLFQIGGLGILTFGAMVAVLSGRQGLQFREARTLRDMLDSDSVLATRSLLLTILLFTVLTELIGAVLLMGLWPDLSLAGRFQQGLFHSVSAFCNAGFSLSDDGFLGQAGHWQVWGPLCGLIVLGGLGFPVVRDLARWMMGRWSGPANGSLFRQNQIRPRLSVHSRLVLISTVFLVVGGTVAWYALESLTPVGQHFPDPTLADAWFQSITFRTAGFNTVDHGQMTAASKLLAIALMFIGAAPGSTGGGVKTVVFVVAVLNILAVIRGRDRVEVFGRCLPAQQVSRALAIIACGLFVVLGTTGLLVVFEQQPERFLDHLYEATSAFATVGVSTGITGDLSLPSRLTIVVVMFLGRIGPVTLLLAMAGSADDARYDYPVERVSLG